MAAVLEKGDQYVRVARYRRVFEARNYAFSSRARCRGAPEEGAARRPSTSVSPPPESQRKSLIRGCQASMKSPRSFLRVDSGSSSHSFSDSVSGLISPARSLVAALSAGGCFLAAARLRAMSVLRGATFFF